MALTSNAAGTGTILAALFDHEYDPKLLRLTPPLAKFTTLTRRMGRHVKVPTNEFTWTEQDRLDRWIAVITDTASTTTTFSVTAAQMVNVRNNAVIVVASSRELIRVTSLGALGFKGVRDVGVTSTGTASIKATTSLFVATYALEDGHDLTAAQWDNPSELYGYTQRWERVIKVTTGGEFSKLKIENERTRRRKDEYWNMYEDIEYAMLLMKKSKNTGGTQNVYVTDAAVNRLGTFLNVNGTLTHAKWRTFRQTMGQYGSDHKVLFAGPIYLHYLSALKAGKLEIKNDDPAYNIALYKYTDDFGTMDIVNAQQIFRDSDFQKYALCLDMEQIKIRVFRDLKMHPDCVQEGQDYVVDKLTADMGLEMKFANAHYGFYGATSFTGQ